MLAIVTTQLTASQLFVQRSIFRMLMKLKGLDYRYEPMVQALRRIGIANVMNRNIYRSPNIISNEQAKELVKLNKEWIVIENDKPIAILPTSDLSIYLADETVQEKNETDLMKIPAKRLQVSSIDLRATADSARELFIQEGVEALCISSTIGPDIIRVYGILTRDEFKSSYDI